MDASILNDANLSQTNLAYAVLQDAPLANANLSGTVVTGAIFSKTTERGFTHAQLASTFNFQSKNLEGINLSYNDLTGWDFSGQDLTNASMGSSTLTDVNLSGAVVNGAAFWETTSRGLTHSLLASTSSFQTKNLKGIDLARNDLTGWDFHAQDLSRACMADARLTNVDFTGANLTNASFEDAVLTDASFEDAVLTDANLTGAVVTGTNFSGTSRRGLTYSQLTTTASFQAKNLQGIRLRGKPLNEWDFSGQNLAEATFSNAKMTRADLSGANLSGAQISEASLISADLAEANLTRANLNAATLIDASLIGANFTDAWLSEAKLSNADLSGANLMNARMRSTRLTNANLTNANLHSARLTGADLTAANLMNTNVDSLGIDTALFTSDTVYSQWTVFPEDFDPESAGLTLVSTPLGDINADGSFNVDDLNLLTARIQTFDHSHSAGTWLPDAMFDMNGDGSIDSGDAPTWVTDFKQTHLGDANLDGEVAFSDFLELTDHFGQSGGWSEGDFDLSGDVQFADFLILADNYGKTSGMPISVPEPRSPLLGFGVGLAFLLRGRRRRRTHAEQQTMAPSARHRKEVSIASHQQTHAVQTQSRWAAIRTECQHDSRSPESRSRCLGAVPPSRRTIRTLSPSAS